MAPQTTRSGAAPVNFVTRPSIAARSRSRIGALSEIIIGALSEISRSPNMWDKFATATRGEGVSALASPNAMAPVKKIFGSGVQVALDARPL